MRTLVREYMWFLAAGLTMALIMVVYWQTFSRMTEMWSFRTYQHGWLVYPVALYVLWRKRQALAAAGWHTSGGGIAVTALLVVVWLVARAVGLQVVEFMSATLLIFAVFWSIAGTHAMRKAAFPLLLLLAAVPVGEFLIKPLMHTTAEIASALLHFAGVPVLRDGQFFTLPGGSFEVADVCSGLRYLLAGLMASLAYAYVTYTSNYKRGVFVAVVAVVLVVANGVRAFIVMYVASGTEMRFFAGNDHVIFGMWFFAAAFLAAIWFGEKYADPEVLPPVTPSNTYHTEFSPKAVVVVSIIVLAGPALNYLATDRQILTVADLEPPLFASCTGPGSWSHDWSPDYHGADRLLRVSYLCGEHDTSVFVAAYGQQYQGKELISSVNRVWPADWRRYVSQSSTFVLMNGKKFPVNQVLVRDPAGWRLIWFWYQVGDSVASREIAVKLLELKHTLTLQPAESSVVVVAVSAEAGNDVAVLRQQAEARSLDVMEWRLSRREAGSQNGN